MTELTTPRLLLRPYTSDDVQESQRAILESADTIGRWLVWWSPDYSLQDASCWITLSAQQRQSGDAFDFAVTDRASGHLLGTVSINAINRAYRMGNIGYWIRQSAQGHGYMPEAVRAIAAFGFDELSLTRLEIFAGEHNHPSRRVAEKVGAHFEGIARNRIILRHGPIDAAMYSLVPGDIIR
ncbi:GNAT family N-acetyltransferase [Musicola keenii]|uniref:GNAT family N-acetyltransferase n=1 Tax=Musicola keenii TaxID=2884250 RepID=UPI001786FD58|nr:GNAT family N-acetyltransferase [Musicola keenii]